MPPVAAPLATRPPRLSTLILLTALAVLSLNMFLPSLSAIAEEFRADYALVNLSIAGYAAGTAVLQLILGPLSDRFGRRPVLLAALAIFILASIGCAMAENIRVFLAFRMLQGVVIAGYVVSLAVIRDTTSAGQSASLVGYVSTGMAVAPMLGPMLGGGLDQLFGWRASFVAFIALGAAAFALAWVDLRETNTAPSPSMRRQFDAYPELFRSRRFWGYALCLAFSVGAFYAFLGGAPLVAQSLFSMSPATLGFWMGTITAGYMLGTFLSGRYAGRVALTAMIITGRLIACAGLLAGLALFALGYAHVFTLFGSCVFVGLGNGLTTPSASAGALSVRPKLAGSAAGLAGALSVGGGAAISSITGAVLTEANGAFALLGMMLLSSALGLVAALYVRRIDRREGPPLDNSA